MENDPNKIHIKVCLIGDGGVGKTTYINRVLDGSFIKRYNATKGAVVHDATFWVNQTQCVHFEVWDTAGQEKHAGLKEIYYVGAHAAIFFYDVSSAVSAKNLATWINTFRKVVGEQAPIVVVANKIDIHEKKTNKKFIMSLLRRFTYDYCEVSAKTTQNFEQPFLILARKAAQNPNLVFVSKLDLQPAQIELYPEDKEDKAVDDYYELVRKAGIEE